MSHRLLKRTQAYTTRAEARRQTLALLQLSGESASQVTGIFAALCTSANDRQGSVSMDLGVTNKFEQVGELANTESAITDGQL